MPSSIRRRTHDGVRAERTTRRFDAVAIGAAVMLALAAACAAYPALRSGAPTVGGMLLIVGLAAVVLLGFYAFGSAGEPENDETGGDRLVQALDEPAALVSASGRLRTCNSAWREAMGQIRSLDAAAVSKAGLFAALNTARSGQTTALPLKAGEGERSATVSAAGGKTLLVRLTAADQRPAVDAPAVEPIPEAAPEPRVARAALTLDVFAAKAPFGAALVEGPNPFAARVLQSNSALSAMAGHTVQNQVFGDLIAPASRAEAQDRFTQGQPAPFEVNLAADANRIAHLYITGGEGRFIVYLVDVSEQKQMELQLAQSQKMQAIGQLAGGVAHDFNNLLMAIELRLDELLLRHPVGDPSYESLSQIRQTGARAADLVRKLLAFSRKQTVQRVTLDVGELISESQVLLGRLLPEDVKLDTQYGRDLPKVRADKGQLETAVMNLVVNARDAVKGRGRPGVIRISTARLTHGQAVGLNYNDPLAPPTREVAMIEVSDNGPGIPPEVMKKIFEPFFTTKPQGEGTGLGLSTVYGIVKQADGWIDVSSPPGDGAIFRIFLPVYDAPPEAKPEAPKARPAPRDLSGAGRILFVEDEDMVRGVAARLLRARGYEVIEAADGEEALIICEEQAGKIDLLISDVIMPGMDGPTLLKKARGYLGSAPVMFISGYAEADFSDMLEGETDVTFLPKPININSLAEKVKQALQVG
jgi:two-component system cell cycle sensor histidine kinase/response regulator CckA